MTPTGKTVSRWMGKTLKKMGLRPYTLARKMRSAFNLGVLGGRTENQRIEAAMEAYDKYVGNFGVEIINDTEGTMPELSGWRSRHYWQDGRLLYSNAGDTYDMTLTFDLTRDLFRFQSWGDWVERNSKD